MSVILQSPCARVPLKLAVSPSSSRANDRIGTKDCCVSPISRVGGHVEKSSLTPSQSFKYLRLCFCSDLSVVCPTDHLLDKLLQDLHVTVLSNQILVPLRELQSFLGVINFLASLVNLGRLHMHPNAISRPLGSLPPLHQSAPTSNSRTQRSS